MGPNKLDTLPDGIYRLFFFLLDDASQIAEKYGMTPTEMALKWCHSRSFVASTIIGATSMEQLKENINVRPACITQSLCAPRHISSGLSSCFIPCQAMPMLA